MVKISLTNVDKVLAKQKTAELLSYVNYIYMYKPINNAWLILLANISLKLGSKTNINIMNYKLET